MYKTFRLLSRASVLIPASLLLAATPSLAESNNPLSYKTGIWGSQQLMLPARTLTDGLYVGLAGGYDSYRLHTTINASVNGDTITGTPVINSTGFVGGIFGGYGQNLNNLFYLGGEAFVNFGGASSYYQFNDALANSNYSASLKARTTFGLSLLPGFRLDSASLLYARIGASWLSMKTKETAKSSGVSASASTTNWSPGYIFGFGLETALYKGWSVKGEYTHATYRTTASTTLGTDTAPSDNQVMLGLIYHVF